MQIDTFENASTAFIRVDISSSRYACSLRFCILQICSLFMSLSVSLAGSESKSFLQNKWGLRSVISRMSEEVLPLEIK